MLCNICKTREAQIPSNQMVSYCGELVDAPVCFDCFSEFVVSQDRWGRNTKEAVRASLAPKVRYGVELKNERIDVLKEDPLAHTSGNYDPPYQKHRVEWICEQVEKGKKILDCGSNMWMAELMGATDAVDIDVYNLKVHKAMYPHRRCWWASVNTMPFDDKEFDCVVMGDMLEHLGQDGAEDALKKALRVGRRVVATVPNFDDFNQMWWNPPYHVWEVKESELKDTLGRLGVNVRYEKSPEKHFFYILAGDGV